MADALMNAAEANYKNKLAWTTNEKAEAAWRLAKHHSSQGCYSLRKIESKTGIAKSTVENMLDMLRRSEEDLGFAPQTMTWAEVKRQRRQANTTYDEDWENKQVQNIIDRIRTALGPVPDRQPQLVVEAFRVGFPRVYEAMKEECRVEVAEEGAGWRDFAAATDESGTQSDF